MTDQNDGVIDAHVLDYADQAAFITGRTVTAEQVESVAEVFAEVTGEPQPGRFERTMAHAALTAAGLLIEGDE